MIKTVIYKKNYINNRKTVPKIIEATKLTAAAEDFSPVVVRVAEVEGVKDALVAEDRVAVEETEDEEVFALDDDKDNDEDVVGGTAEDDVVRCCVEDDDDVVPGCDEDNVVPDCDEDEDPTDEAPKVEVDPAATIKV